MEPLKQGDDVEWLRICLRKAHEDAAFETRLRLQAHRENFALRQELKSVKDVLRAIRDKVDEGLNPVTEETPPVSPRLPP